MVACHGVPKGARAPTEGGDVLIVETYARVQTGDEILQNAWRIYAGYFRAFLFAYILPLAPLSVLFPVAIERAPAVAVAMAPVWIVLSYLMTIPVTAIISDICLGNTPGLIRSYRQVPGRATVKIVLASTCVVLLTCCGCVLIVPGIMAMTRLMFVAPVLVLERASLKKVFRRSAELGRGYYGRNLAVYLCAYVLSGLSAIACGQGLQHVLTDNLSLPRTLAAGTSQCVTLLFAPYASSVLVLLYYDMRARKEAFDSAKFAEDFRR